MRFCLILTFNISALILSPLLAAAQNPDPFIFEFEEIAPGVWTGIRDESTRFPVMGNTTFVIGQTGVVVFDGGGVPGMADQIISKIKSVTDRPVTHVIISHWHGDHNFGVYRFAEEFENVQYVAHDFTHRAMNSHKIDYVLGYPRFVEKRLPAFKQRLTTGVDDDGEPLSEADKDFYRKVIKDAPFIDREYKKVKLTQPNLVIHGDLDIHLGGRHVEIKNIGHGNTEGDLIMWLPEERIVAAGDLIVYPAPYAFNVPPRAWAQTLKNLNALDYRILVPGHGKVQTDTKYVDLTIKAAEFIAEERDRLLTAGTTPEDIEAALSLSKFVDAYTNGNTEELVTYEQWFAKPLIKAAMKELTDEPMVALKPRADQE